MIASLSNDAEFFPGLSKSWALIFMVNDEEAPTGRPAGALGWAGLANLLYWWQGDSDIINLATAQEAGFRTQIAGLR